VVQFQGSTIVVLAIEAHRNGTALEWRFAPARMTNREAWVTDRGREVWRVPVPGAGNFDGTTSKQYGVFTVESVEKPSNVK
jgi:hypothetical protein